MRQQARKSCVHRWLLGESTLKRVEAICRRCGVRRRFPSGLEFPEYVTTYEEAVDLPAALVAREVA